MPLQASFLKNSEIPAGATIQALAAWQCHLLILKHFVRVR